MFDPTLNGAMAQVEAGKIVLPAMQRPLNKSNVPPDEWFRRPGPDQPPYADADLRERLLSWELLGAGAFERMLEHRKAKVRERALNWFGRTEEQFAALFEM